MPIAGVVVLVDENKADLVMKELNIIPGVTTYGVHKNNNIIAVFESENEKQLEQMSSKIQNELEGVIGVFPTCVNFEDSESEKG